MSKKSDINNEAQSTNVMPTVKDSKTNTDTKTETKEIKKRRTLDDGSKREDSYIDKESIDASNKAIFDSINSYRKEDMTADEYWERIFYVHLKTKELYILAEEYGSELKTFYLPINSLKDAYENVIHVCANDYMVRNGIATSNDAYVKDNLRKALASECKAFFDTADFLSILLRKKIAECLNGFTYPQIASVWDDYNTVRLELIQINQEISEIRNRKSDTHDFYIDADVEKYYFETKNLLDWYIFIEEKVYPKLEQRFNDI
ncbi:MAG: hypothetical protein MRZ66_06050 [Clostridiales bacterium]|nr:hypothetical protein [Clostridiales bacterium]